MSNGFQYEPDEQALIVVKFVDNIGLAYNDNMTDEPGVSGQPNWGDIEQALPGIRMRRLFNAIPPERIGELKKFASERDKTYRGCDFLSFFAVYVDPDEDIDSYLARLRAYKLVEEAYFDPPAIDPTGDPSNNPRYPQQGYLQQAPGGIDAVYAWSVTGGNGAGQDFIDMEKGWTLDHEDLVDHGAQPPPLVGDLIDGSRPHGTAVLGEVCAVNNHVGVIGVAWKLANMNVVSYKGANNSRPNAIFKAIDALPYGGVLLLEAQLPELTAGSVVFEKIPIETLRADFEAIRLATASGITVIEAGGNGGYDLDFVTDPNGKFVLDGNGSSSSNGPDFRDSGAILVGSASSSTPHTRMPNSNFGKRVDCYAWGENVCTADSTTKPPVETNLYQTGFSETSAASAIIAGAALAVQGAAEASLGFRLSAFQIRDLLADKTRGTPSNNPTVDRIGVMPDLKKLLQGNGIGSLADLYLRDFVGDQGDPHEGQISASPDIILRTAQVADPQAAFGEGSGTENSNTLGSEAVAGQDNYIYARVRNRGGAASANARVDIYWSPVAILTVPEMWNLIGSATLGAVPPADVLTVFDPVTWQSAHIPGAGHYCFVGITGSPSDPMPQVPADISWEEFLSLIRVNNNVTWRNFNVIDESTAAESPLAGFAAFEFLAIGWRDRELPMALELVARLPSGSEVLLELPQDLYELLHYRSPQQIYDTKLANNSVILKMNPSGHLAFPDVSFPAAGRFPLKLHLNIPEDFPDHPYEIYARQVYQGIEVGRVTWRLPSGLTCASRVQTDATT